MKPRYKAYLRLNLMSLFFIAVSFISVTLAWFAYSGLAKVSTDVGVKAWYIELDKNGEAVSDDIVISLSEIYPGMDVVNEVVNVKNMGDSDAQVKYSIVSARILGNPEDFYEVNDTTVTSPHVEDIISHDYPFHVNMNLTKGYALAKGENSSFEVSISWPLDSDGDTLDSQWGTDAYLFQQEEQNRKNLDEHYQVRPAIQIVISLTAEQYLDEPTTSDIRYNLGDVVLYDVENNRRCTELSPTCIKTYIMDTNNKLGDQTVTLLPEPKDDYLAGTYDNYSSILGTITNNWVVSTRPLLAADLLKIVSTDVMHSLLIRNDLSDSIIGNLSYGDRINTELARAVNYNGYYNFVNERFGNFTSVNCYWTASEYNVDNGFAVKRNNDTSSKIYNELKTTNCNVIPVILANKANL